MESEKSFGYGVAEKSKGGRRSNALLGSRHLVERGGLNEAQDGYMAFLDRDYMEQREVVTTMIGGSRKELP